MKAIYDVALFHKEQMFKARKEHKCGECGNPIRIGDVYEHSFGMWYGAFSSFKTCAICKEIRDKMFCSWVYGNIWGDLQEEFQETGLPICQVDGLSKGAIELLSKHILEWLDFEEDEDN